MKKLTFILIGAILLTACTNAPTQSNSTIESVPLAVEELTYSNANGLYTTVHSNDNMISNIVYIDGENATQKIICTRSNCLHKDDTCASCPQGYLRGYYNDSLIYTYTLSDMNDPTVASVTLAISNTNGEDYTELCTIEQSLASYSLALYGDELLFLTASNDKALLHSVNMKTKALRQISPEPFYGAHNFLGAYKDFLFYSYVGNDDATQPYNIIRLNVATGAVDTIYQRTNPLDWSNLNLTNQSFEYYDGKIYTLLPITEQGTNPLLAIDCISGEVTNINEELNFDSPNGQSLAFTLDDNIIIETIANSADLPVPQARRFAYSLSANTLTSLTINTQSVDNAFYPLYFSEVFGDYLLTDYRYIDGFNRLINKEGKVVEVPSLVPVTGIISISDYLKNTASFTDVVNVD